MTLFRMKQALAIRDSRTTGRARANQDVCHPLHAGTFMRASSVQGPCSWYRGTLRAVCDSLGWYLPLRRTTGGLSPTCKVREDSLEEGLSLLSFKCIKQGKRLGIVFFGKVLGNRNTSRAHLGPRHGEETRKGTGTARQPTPFPLVGQLQPFPVPLLLSLCLLDYLIHLTTAYCVPTM